MSTAIRGELTGLRDLQRKLGKISHRLATKATREAAEVGAEVVRVEAMGRAPVSARGSRGHPAGHLASNIVRDTKVVDGTRVEVAVGPSRSAFYGSFVELGTKHTAAQPFLRPAFDEKRNAAIKAARGVLESHLRAAAK